MRSGLEVEKRTTTSIGAVVEVVGGIVGRSVCLVLLLESALRVANLCISLGSLGTKREDDDAGGLSACPGTGPWVNTVPAPGRNGLISLNSYSVVLCRTLKGTTPACTS